MLKNKFISPDHPDEPRKYKSNPEVIKSFIRYFSFYQKEADYSYNLIMENHKELFTKYMTFEIKKSQISFIKTLIDILYPLNKPCPDGKGGINLCDPLTRILWHIELLYCPPRLQDRNFDELILANIRNILTSACPDSYYPQKVLKPIKKLGPGERYKKIVDYVSSQEEHILKERFGEKWEREVHSSILEYQKSKRDYWSSFVDMKSEGFKKLQKKASKECKRYDSIIKSLKSYKK